MIRIGVVFKQSKTFRQLGVKNKGFVTFDVVQLLKKLVRYGNFLITPSAMFQSDVARNIAKNWNSASFGSSADLDIWLRIAEKSKLGLLEAALINYRVSRQDYSYTYNSIRISKSDFIKMMEYWLAKETIQPYLNKSDYYYFAGLQKMDQLLGGIRAYIRNDCLEGDKLLRGTFHRSFFVTFRIKYAFLWVLSIGLKYRLLRWLVKPFMKKLLFRYYLG